MRRATRGALLYFGEVVGHLIAPGLKGRSLAKYWSGEVNPGLDHRLGGSSKDSRRHLNPPPRQTKARRRPSNEPLKRGCAGPHAPRRAFGPYRRRDAAGLTEQSLSSAALATNSTPEVRTRAARVTREEDNDGDPRTRTGPEPAGRCRAGSPGRFPIRRTRRFLLPRGRRDGHRLGPVRQGHLDRALVLSGRHPHEIRAGAG